MPLDILHLAAPCRNVPVTFTLDRSMSCSLLLRALLSVVALVLLLCGGIYEIAWSVWLGEARMPLRRWSGVVFNLRENAVGYTIAVGLWGAVVAAFAWFATRQIRALLQPKRPESVDMFKAQFRELEKMAPSGLLPLWIALAAAALLGMYALAKV